MTVGGVKIADLLPFKQYLPVLLTHAQCTAGREPRTPFRVGSFGYWITAIQFFGFLSGGVATYIYLTPKPVFYGYDLYMRRIAKNVKIFADLGTANYYYDRLFTLELNSPEFAALIQRDVKPMHVLPESVKITTCLLRCPKCRAQEIEEKLPERLEHMNRRVCLPLGTNLTRIFRGLHDVQSECRASAICLPSSLFATLLRMSPPNELPRGNGGIDVEIESALTTQSRISHVQSYRGAGGVGGHSARQLECAVAWQSRPFLVDDVDEYRHRGGCDGGDCVYALPGQRGVAVYRCFGVDSYRLQREFGLGVSA